MDAAAAHPVKHDSETTPPAVLGLVKTTYPRLRAVEAAVNDADYSEFSTAAELDAWARHAAAASGFGDAALQAPPAEPGPVAADRTPPGKASLVAIVAAITTAVGSTAARAIERWRQQREIRRTYLALTDLDERTLKDIGFSNPEISSIAAELGGRAERTRVRALRTLRALSI